MTVLLTSCKIFLRIEAENVIYANCVHIVDHSGRTPGNINVIYIAEKVYLVGYNSVADNMGLSSFT